MALLRAGLFELLICLHVIGAAVLFRRWFPRESPWLGFFLPIVALVSALNFIEHEVALPALGWLLPFTVFGCAWTILRPGFSWVGLRFPSALFVATFTFMFLLKCAKPDIPDYTEGTVDLSRVLNFSLGEKLPPTDSWMPPYDSGGYYALQQYGAALLGRLFSVDIGTALNLSFALLLALTCHAAAGVAYALTPRKWVAALMAIIFAAGSSGAAPVLLLMGKWDYALANTLNASWDAHDGRNPFAWLAAHDAGHPQLILVAPLYTLYCSEFHANLGATWLTLGLVLASVEAFRVERRDWPWVCLMALPMVILVTSVWYFPIALVLSAGGLAVAWLAGRRPQHGRAVIAGGALGIFLLWPNFFGISGNPYAEPIIWNHWATEHTPLWMFLLHWWPVFVPWLFLCLVWNELDGLGRWYHFILPVLFLALEFVSIAQRELTVEKMWGDIYGIALVTLLPPIFAQRRLMFRLLTVVLAVAFSYCLGCWVKQSFYDAYDPESFAVLSGDHGLNRDNQRRRLLEVLRGMRGQTILPGKCYWSYYLAPLEVTESGNRCFVAYTFQEEQYGHGGEADYRAKAMDDFYAGTMPEKLAFLRSHQIGAVLIWPEDKISDAVLGQLKGELAADYYYVDCKMDGKENAGVFLREGAGAR